MKIARHNSFYVTAVNCIAIGLLTGCTTLFRDTFEHDAIDAQPVDPPGAAKNSILIASKNKEVLVRGSSDIAGNRLLELRSSSSGDNDDFTNAFNYPPANVHFGTSVKSSKKRVFISWSQRVRNAKLTTATIYTDGFVPILRLLIQSGQISATLPQGRFAGAYSDNDRHDILVLIDPNAATYEVRIDNLTQPGTAYPLAVGTGTIGKFYDLRFGNVGNFVSENNLIQIDNVEIKQQK